MAKIKCKNCGAVFDAMEPNCPYCGHISYPGAERRFFKNLHHVKNELDDVSETVEKNYKRGMSRQTKFVLIALLIVGCIGIIAVSLFFLYKKVTDEILLGNYDPKEEMIWENQTFPQLDEWYEKGDYDAIVEFQDKLYESDTTHSMYNWEHSDFITAYRYYKDASYIMDKFRKGTELTKYEREDIVYYAIWYHKEQYHAYYQQYSEQDMKLIEGYREEMDKILYDNLKFTDEEVDELYEKSTKKGYFERKPCYKYANKIYERFEP